MSSYYLESVLTHDFTVWLLHVERSNQFCFESFNFAEKSSLAVFLIWTFISRIKLIKCKLIVLGAIHIFYLLLWIFVRCNKLMLNQWNFLLRNVSGEISPLTLLLRIWHTYCLKLIISQPLFINICVNSYLLNYVQLLEIGNTRSFRSRIRLVGFVFGWERAPTEKLPSRWWGLRWTD